VLVADLVIVGDAVVIVSIIAMHLSSFIEIHSPPLYNLAYPEIQSQPLMAITV